jgi:hypothetical protein
LCSAFAFPVVPARQYFQRFQRSRWPALRHRVSHLPEQLERLPPVGCSFLDNPSFVLLQLWAKLGKVDASSGLGIG